MSAPLVAVMQAARLSLERERKARAACSPAALQAHFAAVPAVTCLPYLEGESKLGNMVNLGEVHDGMILTRPLAS